MQSDYCFAYARFNINVYVKKLYMKKTVAVIIGSGFGSGFWPWGPGTAGAFLATAVWVALSFVLTSDALFAATLVLTVVFTVLGVWSANVLAPSWGEDPSRVVVDEMVGVWIPLLGAPAGDAAYALAAFVLFRFFDIVKPLGVRKMENFKGGWGIMADDILAGVYGFIVLQLLLIVL
jgi:phosphatidylglycerophosphatase A